MKYPFGLFLIAATAFGISVIAGQNNIVSLGKYTKLTTWDSAGKCGVTVNAKTLHLKLATDVSYPCRARVYNDGTLVSYVVEDADAVFIVCGNITNRKDKNKTLKKDYFEGQGYQGVILKEGKVWLSELKDNYCTPHSFEAPQHALLAQGELKHVKAIEYDLK